MDWADEIINEILSRWIPKSTWDWKIYKLRDDLSDSLREVASGDIPN